MKKNLIIMQAILVISLIVFILGGCSQAAPTSPPAAKTPTAPPAKQIVWDFYHIHAPGQYPATIFDWTMAEVEKRSNGRLAFKAHPAAEYGFFGVDAFDSAVKGVYQVFSMPDAYIESVLPITAGHYLPFLLESWDEQKAIIPVYEKYLDPGVTNRWPLVRMYTASYALHQLHSTKPIKGIADLNGYKVREASRIQRPLWQSVGVVPTTVAGPEVYVSLQRGVINGAISANFYGIEQKWYEVTKYVYQMNMGAPSFSTWASKEALQALPADLQNIVKQVFTESTEKIWNEYSRDWDKKTRDELLPAQGVTIAPMPADIMKKFKDMTITVWEDWAKATGPEAAQFLKEARAVLKK